MQGGGIVILAGATKGGASHCTSTNGVFDLVPELYNGRALFRKRDDKTLWLRFTKNKNWAVSSTAEKDANSNSGWAFAPGTDSDLPPVSGWSVADSGVAFVPDEGVGVTQSDAVRSAVSSAALCSLSMLVLLAMCSCDVATSHIHKRAMACLASACECVAECTTAAFADLLQMNDCACCFNAGRWHRHSCWCHQGRCLSVHINQRSV
jgi:hypothetical protein